MSPDTPSLRSMLPDLRLPNPIRRETHRRAARRATAGARPAPAESPGRWRRRLGPRRLRRTDSWLASSHRRDDGHNRSVADGCLHLLEVPDVLVVDEHIDVRPQLATVEELRTDRWVLLDQVSQGRLNSRSGNAYFSLAAGVLPQRRRDFNLHRHESLPDPPQRHKDHTKKHKGMDGFSSL